MTPQHQALKKKLLDKKNESPRSKEIREINSRSSSEGTAMKVIARHERRHNRGHRTSLSERKEWMGQMSKDS